MNANLVMIRSQVLHRNIWQWIYKLYADVKTLSSTIIVQVCSCGCTEKARWAYRDVAGHTLRAWVEIWLFFVWTALLYQVSSALGAARVRHATLTPSNTSSGRGSGPGGGKVGGVWCEWWWMLNHNMVDSDLRSWVEFSLFLCGWFCCIRC